MNWQLTWQLSSLIAVTSFWGISNALAVVPADPQPQTTASSLISLEFPPSGREGAPRTSGGGTRTGNSCVSDEGTQLTALMPTRSNVGKTAQDDPTLYWFVPENTANTGEFVLIDEDGNEVYYTSFALPKHPGIVSLTLPGETNLKVGHNYLWYFTVVCDEFDRGRDRYLEGRLDRTDISSSIEQTIQQLTPLKQAEIYAEYGIWHETIALVADLRSEQPHHWQELLSSVGLEFLSEEEVQPLTVE